MEPAAVALVSGLVGAVIGAAASVTTILIQSHYQSKRDFSRMAVDAAIEDHRHALEAAKTHSRQVQLAPLTAYLHFHFEYLKLLQGGKLDEESLRALRAQRDQLFGPPESS